MSASKFTDAQIKLVQTQAEDGAAVSDVCWKVCDNDATCYNCREKCAKG